MSDERIKKNNTRMDTARKKKNRKTTLLLGSLNLQYCSILLLHLNVFKQLYTVTPLNWNTHFYIIFNADTYNLLHMPETEY